MKKEQLQEQLEIRMTGCGLDYTGFLPLKLAGDIISLIET